MVFRPQGHWEERVFCEQAYAECSQWIPLHDGVNADGSPQFLEFSLTAVSHPSENKPMETAQSASFRELQLCASTDAFPKAVVAHDASVGEADAEQPRCASTTPADEQGQSEAEMSSVIAYRNVGIPTPHPTDDVLSEQEDFSEDQVTFPDVLEMIVGHIWQFLSFADLAALESVNMRLFGICESDALWRQIYHHHACSAWRCEEREVLHSCDANHRARQMSLLKHSKREGSCKSSSTSVDADLDFVQDAVAGTSNTIAEDPEIPAREVRSIAGKISSFVSKAVRTVRQRWLQSVVELSGSLGIARWFRLNQTAGLNLCGERELLYAVRRTATMENCGTLIPTPCSNTKEKRILQDTDITASLSEMLVATSDSTSVLSGRVPLLPVSRFKVMLLEEFANVEEEKLALLKERVALLKDINRFRHELRHLILNFENPGTTSSSSSFSAPQERLLYLKELLANQPDRTSEIENVTTRVIPRVLATVRAFHNAIHAFRIRIPPYCKEDTPHSILQRETSRHNDAAGCKAVPNTLAT